MSQTSPFSYLRSSACPFIIQSPTARLQLSLLLPKASNTSHSLLASIFAPSATARVLWLSKGKVQEGQPEQILFWIRQDHLKHFACSLESCSRGRNSLDSTEGMERADPCTLTRGKCQMLVSHSPYFLCCHPALYFISLFIFFVGFGSLATNFVLHVFLY